MCDVEQKFKQLIYAFIYLNHLRFKKQDAILKLDYLCASSVARFSNGIL